MPRAFHRVNLFKARRASLRLVASDPVPVTLYRPCAGVFAFNPCFGTNYLQSQLTLTVSSTNDIGGRGTIGILVVDAANRQPVAIQGILTSPPLFALEPNASISLPVEWKRDADLMGPGRVPPEQLAFIVSVHFTDTMRQRVSETVMVSESLPRTWQLF